jgi:copper chaperone
MCGTTETRTQLPLASTAQHGCSCCSPDAETPDAAPPAEESEVPASGAQYALKGLTCGHCVQTVEKAVSGVSGVESATVGLVPGGMSRLSITGAADPEALADAVRSSGYVLAGATAHSSARRDGAEPYTPATILNPPSPPMVAVLRQVLHKCCP